jgi:hypothetical protein
MTNLLPVDGWHHTSFVVRDYRQVVSHFARFFGISRWEVTRMDGKRLSQMTFEGGSVTHRYIRVTGRSDGLGIELIQPVDGPSSYQAMLDHVGEGMHHVNATRCSPQTFEAAKHLLDKMGVTIRQSAVIEGVVQRYLLDTRTQLANIQLEVDCLLQPDWQTVLVPDEVLQFDLAALGPQILPTRRMFHIGVVCRDRHAVKENLRQLLGMSAWIEFNVETGKTMSDTTFYGKAVSHAYDNHVGRLGELCFELITPRTDQCVYDEFLHERGEGMHHTFPSICSKAELSASLPMLEDMGMPIIQGGTIGDLLEYYYIDTRKYLPGVTTEVVIPLREDWLNAMFPNPQDAWILTGD